MADNRVIHSFRIFRRNGSDEKLIEQSHEISARSIQLLKDNPVPDTFAGRKTQEPFPMPDEE